MGNHTKSDLIPATKKPVKRKPADNVKSDAKKDDKAKSEPLKTTNSLQESPLKPYRRRPPKPYYLNILYPKQKDILKAITGGMDTSLIFRDHLIKAKLFEEAGENISLVPPKSRERNRLETSCEKPAQLLDELVFILSTYFANQRKTKGNFEENFKLEMEYIKALGKIGMMRESFISIGVREKSFDDVLAKLQRWICNWVRHRESKLKTPKWDDLKVILFYNVKKMTNLSNWEIFICLARLLKYFGLDVGKEVQIAYRLKSEYHSKGKDILNGLMPFINDPASQTVSGET
jgi:hypothetical protein